VSEGGDGSCGRDSFPTSSMVVEVEVEVEVEADEGRNGKKGGRASEGEPRPRFESDGGSS